MSLIVPDQPEEWRPVVGHEDRYEVSDHGRVRSLRLRGRGFDRLRPQPRVMRLSGAPGEYQQVQLGLRGPQPLVHVMVLEAFVGPRPDGHEGAHGNGRRDDNRLDNLRWATPADNHQDREIHGTVLRGEAVGTSKLTQADVALIRGSADSAAAFARRFGVTPGAIKHVRRGRNWRVTANG